MFPDEDLPEFRVVVAELYKSAIACSMKILEAMGYALQLEVRDSPKLYAFRNRFSKPYWTDK